MMDWLTVTAFLLLLLEVCDSIDTSLLLDPISTNPKLVLCFAPYPRVEQVSIQEGCGDAVQTGYRAARTRFGFFPEEAVATQARLHF